MKQKLRKFNITLNSDAFEIYMDVVKSYFSQIYTHYFAKIHRCPNAF